MERYAGTYYSLVREWNEDVLLCALGLCHVLFLVVKLVVAGLGASDELGEKFILERKKVKIVVGQIYTYIEREIEILTLEMFSIFIFVYKHFNDH